MRTVHDDDGQRYLLVKRSSESSLVRHPETGEERYVPNDRLTVDDSTDPLSLAAGAVSGPVRRVLSACRDDRALGLLLELDRRGPVPARALLEYDLCESDVLGLVGEFRAAGLVVEAAAAGERGYDLTDDAREALAVLRAGRGDR
ncbi:DUF7346 family protein [Halomarina oriensis]|uniref:ArsR family transcriptional regulator n=1 Tax=Halomarina oriensis TaxID=671145 RepID=A0A6B0GQT6_9EURY|nr:hypothetical protein [Halomarina oriensis]MWG36441.1 hypothetical protein [Halomarina oriensis]